VNVVRPGRRLSSCAKWKMMTTIIRKKEKKKDPEHFSSLDNVPQKNNPY
jgi:hypothetical protein